MFLRDTFKAGKIIVFITLYTVRVRCYGDSVCGGLLHDITIPYDERLSHAVPRSQILRRIDAILSIAIPLRGSDISLPSFRRIFRAKLLAGESRGRDGDTRLQKYIRDPFDPQFRPGRTNGPRFSAPGRVRFRRMDRVLAARLYLYVPYVRTYRQTDGPRI